MSELLSARAVQEVDPTRTIEAIAKQGCKFVVEGDIFVAVITLLDRLLADNALDATGWNFVTQLRTALESTSIPVRPKERSTVISSVK